MPRNNSQNWSIADPITAARLNHLNQDLDDLYLSGDDRLKAFHTTGRNIEVKPGNFRIGSIEGIYTGGTVLIPASSTRYISLKSDGSLEIGTTAFNPDNLRIAVVVANASTITSIVNWKHDGLGGQLGGGMIDFFSLITPHDMKKGLQSWIQSCPVGGVYNYTVPAGKVLYITHGDGDTNGWITVGGARVFQIYTYSNGKHEVIYPIIVPAGVTVAFQTYFSNSHRYGFLLDANPKVTPIHTAGNYTVPTGKTYLLVSMHRTNLATEGGVTINGTSVTISRGYNYGTVEDWHPIILQAGDQVRPSTNTASGQYGLLFDSDLSF